MVRLIAMMMEDMSEVYPQFFLEGWYTSNPPLMSTIVVTLKDYFTTELSPHMLSPVFQDLSIECAKRIVKVYCGHLIEKKTPPFNSSTVARMQKDIDELRSFFGLCVREKTLEEILQPVVLLRQLLDANYQLIASYYGAYYFTRGEGPSFRHDSFRDLCSFYLPDCLRPCQLSRRVVAGALPRCVVERDRGAARQAAGLGAR